MEMREQRLAAGLNSDYALPTQLLRVTAQTRQAKANRGDHPVLQHFSLLGTRLFNTANGYTRGDIYRASALTLGEERLEGTTVAVLDLRTMDDIDGLLGMNVLRQFHFEIDQSAGAMQIRRR
jgi:hypothetical protein